MKAEIVTIGTEIILGSIVNSNAVYISKRLAEMGIETLYHTSVDDDFNRLKSVIEIAKDRVDIVITTGGLGPTDDDLSKEAIASALGLPMESDTKMEDELKYFFSYSQREMTLNNLKQAMKPLGSEFIPNPKGTAPGIYIKHDDKIIIMMPGPPREMIPMLDNYVVDYIKDDHIIAVKSINTIGIGESQLETDLKELNINMEGFTISTYASKGCVEIKIIGKSLDKDYLEENTNLILEKIKSKIGQFIYGYDNSSVEKVIIDTLVENNLKLAVCESCTGGNISSRITSIPGASSTFDRGIITYSNLAKVDEVGVKESTLKEFGAVSEQVAIEMALGLLNKSGSDITVSTTGNAGPTSMGDTPVGLIYTCVADKESHQVFKRIFSGDRDVIQERATNFALGNLYNFLNKKLT